MFITKKKKCPNDNLYFRYFEQAGQVIESGLTPSDVNPAQKHTHQIIAPSKKAEFTANEFKAQVKALVKNEKCYVAFHELDKHSMHAHVIAKA
jgi:hypothetical protein